MLRLIPLTIALLMVACSSNSTNESSGGSGPGGGGAGGKGGSDGGLPSGGAAGTGGTTALDAAPDEGVDGGSDGGGGDAGAQACNIKPASTFHYPTNQYGVACNWGNVVDADTVMAGLDYSGTAFAMLDGVSVTGCLGVDFGIGVAVDAVLIGARAVAKACDTTCSTACGVPIDMRIFSSLTTNYKYVGDPVVLTSTLENYPIKLSSPARLVIVCRGGSGPGSDDVEIDFIAGCD